MDRYPRDAGRTRQTDEPRRGGLAGDASHLVGGVALASERHGTSQPTKEVVAHIKKPRRGSPEEENEHQNQGFARGEGHEVRHQEDAQEGRGHRLAPKIAMRMAMQGFLATFP